MLPRHSGVAASILKAVRATTVPVQSKQAMQDTTYHSVFQSQTVCLLDTLRYPSEMRQVELCCYHSCRGTLERVSFPRLTYVCDHNYYD